MDLMTMAKTTNHKKTTNTKSAKGKKSAVQPEVSRAKVACVSIGMILLAISIFAVASLISYIYSGAEDFSFCEAHRSSEIFSRDVTVHNVGGKIGVLVSYFLMKRCFGLASIFIPIFLALASLRMIGSYRINLIKAFIKSALLMVWLSVVLSVVSMWIPGIADSHLSLGGNHGDAVRAVLYNAVGEVGVYVIIALSVIFVLIYLSVRTVDRITEFFRFRQIQKVRELAAKLRKKKSADDKNDFASDGNQETRPLNEETSKTLVFGANGQLITDEGTDASSDTNVVDLDVCGIDGEEPDQTDENIASAFDQIAQHASKQEEIVNDNEKEPDFTIDAVVQTEQGDGNIERGDILTPYDPKLDLEHYEYPPISLLDRNENEDLRVDLDEQNANKERIIRVLKSFGVEISTIKATIGPTITLYEITPAEGTRINKIRNLEDDIALSLAAEGIRIIAPIPGKGTIGIEVPNKKKQIVSMESVINSKTYQESKMELPCALGKTITNEVFMVDLAKAPHMLVAGATGMGKSVGLNAIVTSLLYKKHPSELKMVMVDPKKVEFSVYSPIANQFLAKLEDEDEAIITDNQRVIKTLNALCKLMDDRYQLLKRAQVRNIKEYNTKFKERKLNPNDGHEYMPYYVVIIDEFGDLIMTAGKEIELPICRIAQLARAVGIHMIIATQRPTTRIITGTIKANFPARVAFKVAAMMDSRIILDRPGANQLIGRGDMLYLQNADPVRVQCAFVDTPEVNRICQYISEQQKFPHMTYLPEPPMDESEGGSDKDVDMQHLDPMFADVAKMVVSQNAGSTSLIQRKFSIGYNRAGRLMDQLEKAGVVGAQIGSKPREVLITDLLTLDSLLNSLGVQ